MTAAAGLAAVTRAQAAPLAKPEGKVVRIMDFGAFVSLLPGRDGMVHISQICEERIQNVTDKLAVGDSVRVKVMEIDKQGRVRLTMRQVDA